MKRILAMLLVLMTFLCACAREPSTTEESAKATTVPSGSSTPEDPVRPNFGLYEPGSIAEVQTSGAVKCFPLENTDYYALEPMGDGLLLFSGDNETTLTLLREDVDPVTVTLDRYIYPDNSTVRIGEDGLYYFNNFTYEIVHLSPSLQEITRVALPKDAQSFPTLSGDGKLAYYYASDSLRCLELETGISRLLKVSAFQAQETWGLHFDSSVLQCYVFNGESSSCQFISTATGELLAEYDDFPDIRTHGSRYFAEYFDRDNGLYLFGIRGEKPQCLQPAQPQSGVQALLELDGGLFYERDTHGTSLSFYDLEQGTRSSQVRLEGVDLPLYVTVDESTGLIWFLASDLTVARQAMYCWDPQLSPTGDGTSYVTPYYTALEPDKAGLSEIAEQVKELGDRYGIRIRVWENARQVMPDDYTFETEYLVPVYEKCVPVLEKALSTFPEGFLKKLGKDSGNGVLTVSLVREIYGDNELGSLTSADGVHFWKGGSSYIALVMGENMERNLYHEVFHAIDSFVMAESTAYDNWDDLNPEGFVYDYSYINNQFREDEQYLEEENRAFIDMYSMSFPKEDRARIMEYAMMEGNESYFQSDIMQAKLKTLCKGIRDAFGLKKDTGTFLWEQYLNESLSYQG